MPPFRLGIYVFKDVEIVDFAAPHGVFSVARRFNPELEAFLGAVEEGAESPCSVADARRALVVALAADSSMRERRPVRVDDFS